MIANRFDWTEWSNLVDSEEVSGGMVLEGK